MARLRHGALRGRTDRHGYVARCNSVHSSSHRYWRNQIEVAGCAVHLCSADTSGPANAICTRHPEAGALAPQTGATTPPALLLEGFVFAGCTRSKRKGPLRRRKPLWSPPLFPRPRLVSSPRPSSGYVLCLEYLRLPGRAWPRLFELWRKPFPSSTGAFTERKVGLNR